MAKPYEVEIRGDDASQRAFKSAKNSIDGIENALKRTARAGRETTSVFRGMTLSRVAVDAAYKLADALERAVAAGFQYNKTIETSRLGIASIVASQTTLVDAEGKILKGREALNAAMKLSTDLVKQIEIRGLQTTATTEQLVTAFQNAVGPATAMGLSLRQTRDITLDVVQAAGALGVPMNQLNEEVRSIVSGTIRMDSRVAKALGLTNEMVKSWAQQNILAEKLQERLATFRTAGKLTATTWQGLTSNMEEAIAKISGELTKGVFDDLKRSMAGVLDQLIVVNEEGVRLAPGILEAKGLVDDLWGAFKAVVGTLGDFVALEDIVSLLKSAAALTRKMAEGWRLIFKESGFASFVRQGIKSISEGWEHITGLLTRGTAYLDEIGNAQERVNEGARRTEEAVAGAINAYGQLAAEKIDAYRKAFRKTREFLEKEHDLVRRLEEQKVDLARKTADVRRQLADRELEQKRRLADFDLNEKRLKRELDILKGRRGELTDEERKKDRIQDIERRLKRLQEDRLKTQQEHTRAVEAAKEEVAKLNRQAKDVDKKFLQATANVSLLERALEQSSGGALKFNENLGKAVTTANQLAQNLITAGKAIAAYNASLPEELRPKEAFRFEKLEQELQAPMQSAAAAAAQVEQKVKAVKDEIPKATQELERKKTKWEEINRLADEHLSKVERIRLAMREWGFQMEGVTDTAGAYGPGY